MLPVALACALAACTPAASDSKADAAVATPHPSATPVAMTDAQLLAHGEYMVRIAGCNDCHTPGYAESGGKVPKTQWLVGSRMGWNGPWGTTYAANLRLKLADMEDAAWLKYSAELHTRPPMPDFAVRDMSEQDRLAILRFTKSLGADGEPAPAYLPPGQTPPLPFIEFNLPPPPAAAASSVAKPAAAG
ncbi:putative diheme cytochrome c-553 [Lysobacter dokdonensis DS-58]|uniref:Putative diheme cytochrome c-553 n=2 Tax=Noviluteimonas TaxID=3382693 RepID=A0A0A2WDC2_9GAMM|nr:putative diheme cytochrome c-553 [Lysobacter dokdonensis DS-58]